MGSWTCELWSCFGSWGAARVRSCDGALFVCRVTQFGFNISLDSIAVGIF